MEIISFLILAEGRSEEELNILGNILTVIGALLMAQASVLACRNLEAEKDEPNSKDLVKAVAALEFKIASIEKKLEKN